MLVKGGLVFRNGDVCMADVRLEGDHVSSIGILEPLKAEEVVDARGMLITPGLVNAHVHSGENFNKGMFENLPLELWFIFSHQIVGASRPSPREIYIRTLLGSIEMLRTGTTSVVDMLYEAPWPTRESISAVMQAYLDAGMRCCLVIGSADKPFYDTIPVNMSLLSPELKEAIDQEREPPLEYWTDLIDEVFKDWQGKESRLSIGVGPSAPQRCTDRFLIEMARVADEKNLPLHTHCHETKIQAASAPIYYGKSMVGHLSDIAFLSPRTTLIHTVWLTGEDIELMARTGTSAVHCLLSNLRLGSGICPVPQFVRRGVNIGLGTDGAGCNDSLDMFEVLKMTALVHKVHGPDYRDWLTAESAWEMATIGGARCGFLKTGEISVGAAADLLLLNLNTPQLLPLNHALRQLVYTVPSRSVEKVLVGGKVVVDRGRILSINEEEILQEALELAKRRKAGFAEVQRQGRQILPCVEEAYSRLIAEEVGINAYIGGGKK